VQIVHSTRRGSRDIEHLGSAHDESELEALKVAAQRRIAAGQAELDLGLDAAVGSGPLEIVSSRMSHLWDALCRGYDTLRFTDATGGDEPFRDLVLARIIEPTSKLDPLRVLDEVGTDRSPTARSRVVCRPTRNCRAAAARRGVRAACRAGTDRPHPL
jgi:hypothetical protein